MTRRKSARYIEEMVQDEMIKPPDFQVINTSGLILKNVQVEITYEVEEGKK